MTPACHHHRSLLLTYCYRVLFISIPRRPFKLRHSIIDYHINASIPHHHDKPTCPICCYKPQSTPVSSYTHVPIQCSRMCSITRISDNEKILYTYIINGETPELAEQSKHPLPPALSQHKHQQHSSIVHRRQVALHPSSAMHGRCWAATTRTSNPPCFHSSRAPTR